MVILGAMQTHRLTLVSAAVFGLGACASAPVPVNYAPSSVLSCSGATGVAEFSYLPADPETPHAVAADQIRNTAMGEIHIDREVRTFVRDAIFAELRFTGIKTDDRTRLLHGQIQEFLIDDLGYSIDWTLRIRYWVIDAEAHAVLFLGVKDTQRRTAKGANVFGALNETIKLNAEALMKDPAFRRVISVGATPPSVAAPPRGEPEAVPAAPVQPSS